MPSRHRFLEPIHNVKDGAEAPNRDRSRNWFLHSWKILGVRHTAAVQRSGGAYRDRTDDLKLAKLALSQLS